jgi:predicted CopG family antitoxin
MSKNVNLDEDAVAALNAHRRKGESYSEVIKRLVAPPIRTFGDLEKFLAQSEGPILELDILERICRRKQESTRAR